MAKQQVHGSWVVNGNVYTAGEHENLPEEDAKLLKERGAFDQPRAESPATLDDFEQADRERRGIVSTHVLHGADEYIASEERTAKEATPQAKGRAGKSDAGS